MFSEKMHAISDLSKLKNRRHIFSKEGYLYISTVHVQCTFMTLKITSLCHDYTSNFISSLDFPMKVSGYISVCFLKENGTVKYC